MIHVTYGAGATYFYGNGDGSLPKLQAIFALAKSRNLQPGAVGVADNLREGGASPFVVLDRLNLDELQKFVIDAGCTVTNFSFEEVHPEWESR